MEYELPLKIKTVLQNLIGFYQVNRKELLLSILQKSKYEIIEAVSMDNWNGGQIGHDLRLDIPFSLFCEIVNDKDKYQKTICEDINKFHGFNESENGPNEWIESVHINSLPYDVQDPESKHIKLIQKQLNENYDNALTRIQIKCIKIVKISNPNNRFEPVDKLKELYSIIINEINDSSSEFLTTVEELSKKLKLQYSDNLFDCLSEIAEKYIDRINFNGIVKSFLDARKNSYAEMGIDVEKYRKSQRFNIEMAVVRAGVGNTVRRVKRNIKLQLEIFTEGLNAVETDTSKSNSDESQKRPRVFVSYSWSSEEHKEWVISLATRLRTESGLDAILDRWNLRGGHDANFFMEQIPLADKVLIICDEQYKHKADARTGGVGKETQYIIEEVHRDVKQEKYLPIIKEKGDDGVPFKPKYLETRVHFDLSSSEIYENEYEKLVYALYDINDVPPLGAMPSFVRKSNISEKVIELGRKGSAKMSYSHHEFWVEARKIFSGICKDFGAEWTSFDRYYLTQRTDVFGCSAEWSIIAGKKQTKEKLPIRVELVFKDKNAELNKSCFNELENNKKMIEDVFGHKLQWDYESGRVKQIIGYEGPWGRREDASPKEIAEWLEEYMEKLQKAIRCNY